jgi:hypothetical protein
MTSQPSSPGRTTEHFDTTGLIPLPGGNFGLDFVDPNLYSSFNTEDFGDTIFGDNQFDSLTGDASNMWWGEMSPATGFDLAMTGLPGTDSKSPAPPPVTPGRPLSPFSNALHGFRPSLGLGGRNGAEKSPVLAKKEVDEHKSILEQIHKDENSVMPPPGLTRAVGSTSGTAPSINSVSPTSGSAAQTSTPGRSGTHIRNASAESLDENDDDKGEDGSDGEEAADLLVYFHARSGAGESSALDDSIEVPGDDRRPRRTMSGSSGSISPVGSVHRKRKRTEMDQDEQIPHPNNKVVGINTGNIFPGKPDGTATAKEQGKGMYVDQAPPAGSVDVLNLLR